jgi:preprotein translocase SecE subunit
MVNKEQSSSGTVPTQAKGHNSVSSPKPDHQEEKKHSGLTAATQFLREVAIEHRKIAWPDRQQIMRETWSVLVLVSCITLIVLGIDWVLGHAVFGPLEHWAKLYGAGLGRG